LDESTRLLCRGGEPIHLSPKAYELLLLLLKRQPEALSKSDILDALWRDTFVSEGNVAVLIKEIRDALGDDAQRPTYIRTVQRFGYAFSGVASDDQPRAAAPCWLTWGTHRATLLMGHNILGRDPAGDVVIDMMGVSRRHAMIAVAGEDVTLIDLGSKNGTFVDDKRIDAAVPLGNDAEIRLGPVSIRFRRLDGSISTQTLDTSRIMRS
jgi:hypothetical protein